MKSKTKLKILVDILMCIVLFICMSYQFMVQKQHEISGTIMFILFIFHHILNVNWFTRITKGKYNAQRIFLTVIDLAILINMLLLMISGIRMSRTVFAFLDLKFISMSTARKIHMVTSYLGFLIMGIHIGMHFGMILNNVRRLLKKKNNKSQMTKKNITSHVTKKNIMNQMNQMNNQSNLTWIARGIDLVLAIYGIYALVKRHFISYITLKLHFVIFHYNEPIIFYLIDLLAITILMGSFGYYIQKLLSRNKKKL